MNKGQQGLDDHKATDRGSRTTSFLPPCDAQLHTPIQMPPPGCLLALQSPRRLHTPIPAPPGLTSLCPGPSRHERRATTEHHRTGRERGGQSSLAPACSSTSSGLHPHLSPPLALGGSRIGKGAAALEGQIRSRKLHPALITWDTCQTHSSCHLCLHRSHSLPSGVISTSYH